MRISAEKKNGNRSGLKKFHKKKYNLGLVNRKNMCYYDDNFQRFISES